MKKNVGYLSFLPGFVLVLLILLAGCAMEAEDLSGLVKQDKVQPGDQLYAAEFARMDKLQQACAPLWPLQDKLSATRPGEWLFYNKEKEQTLKDYIRHRPIILTSQQNTLYLCACGDFTPRQKKALPLIREFLQIYFQCPVKWIQPIEIKDLPPEAVPGTNRNSEPYLNTIALTDRVLKSRIPADGWGLLAVTGNEIHKSGNRGEQYGDALLFGRAGVISLYHFEGKDRRRFLERALKGASHEAGHLLSIPHCTHFYCNMNGRVGLDQFDRCPLHLCPQCLSKLLYATGGELKKRNSELEAFAQQHSLKERYYYQSATRQLEK